MLGSHVKAIQLELLYATWNKHAAIILYCHFLSHLFDGAILQSMAWAVMNARWVLAFSNTSCAQVAEAGWHWEIVQFPLAVWQLTRTILEESNALLSLRKLKSLGTSYFAGVATVAVFVINQESISGHCILHLPLHRPWSRQ